MTRNEDADAEFMGYPKSVRSLPSSSRARQEEGYERYKYEVRN
jgi:hypothetical protein